LNQLLKHFYFNNTNHGGAAGNGGKNSVGLYTNGVISGNHCRPLMLLCQRSVMWKLGIGDAFFEDLHSGTVCGEQLWNNKEHETMTSDDAIAMDQDDDYQPVITYGIL
jgi:hypothetical protein